jgi:hypothetical protein
VPEEKVRFRDFCIEIFQMEEYRELGYMILAQIVPASTTKKMLRDLVVGIHYFIYVMEKVVEQGELVRVQKAIRRRKAKKQKKVEEKEKR